ncbi:MAG: DNA-directed RNA polymerase subunit omega [Clostridia bacterium]|nr:DNA-directed RNA polymerase subunit omega [Clostridia bacterium]
MLRPSDIEQLKGDNSRYAMVVAVAKHAREIADKAIENNEIIIEKPVSLAIEDFKGGDYKVFMNEEEVADEAEAVEE